MVRKCSVCTHKDHIEIDKDIVKGVSYHTITHQYGITIDAIKWHVKAKHINKKIQKTAKTEEEKEALMFKDYVSELNEKDREAFLQAHGTGTPREKSEATKTRIGTLSLLGKFEGELVDKKEITGSNGGPIEQTVILDIEAEVNRYANLLPALMDIRRDKVRSNSSDE